MFNVGCNLQIAWLTAKETSCPLAIHDRWILATRSIFRAANLSGLATLTFELISCRVSILLIVS